MCPSPQCSEQFPESTTEPWELPSFREARLALERRRWHRLLAFGWFSCALIGPVILFTVLYWWIGFGVVFCVALLALVWRRTQQRIRAETPTSTANYLDRRFQLQERASTIVELSEADPRYTFLAEQIGSRAPAKDAAILEATFSKSEIRGLGIASIFFIAGIVAALLIWPTPSAVDVEALTTLNDALQDQNLDPELKKSLQSVKSAIESHGIGSEEVREALARADEQIEAQENALNTTSSTREDNAKGSEDEQKMTDQAEKQERHEKRSEAKESQEQQEKNSQDGSSQQSQSGQSGQGDKQQSETKGKEDQKGKGQGQGEKGEGQGQGQGDGSGQGQDGSKGSEQQGKPSDQGSGNGQGESKDGSKGEARNKDAQGSTGDGASKQDSGHDSAEASGDKGDKGKQGADGKKGDSSDSKGADSAKDALQKVDDLQKQAENKQGEKGSGGGGKPSKSDQPKDGSQGQGGEQSSAMEKRDKKSPQTDQQEPTREPPSGKEDNDQQEGDTGTGASLPKADAPKKLSEEGEEGPDVSGRVRFEDALLSEDTQNLDPSDGQRTGRTVETDDGGDYKTERQKLEVARPDPESDPSKQPIPLEYREVFSQDMRSP